MCSSPRSPLFSPSCVGLTFQPKSPTTACLGTSHQIRILHLQKSADSISHVQGVVGPQVCIKQGDRFQYYHCRCNKHATCRTTIDVHSRADAYHAIHKLSLISRASGIVSSHVYADANAIVSVYGLWVWQSLRRCWPGHGFHANSGSALLATFLTTHCQHYNCGVLRVIQLG